MSRWSRDADEIYRDVLIALWHPEYRECSTIDALAALKRRRQA